MTVPGGGADGVAVRRVDPRDETDLRHWWESGRLAAAERPYDAWPPWEVSRRALPRPRDDQRLVLLAARTQGGEAGAGLVVLPDVDDVHTATVEVHVRPALRRRGVGGALLAAAEAVAVTEGRGTLWSEAFAPVDGPGAGPGFATRHGWTVAEENSVRLLDLGAAPQGWRALERRVAARADGHRVLTVVDRVPDAIAEGVCALLTVFASMLPDSDLDHRGTPWSVQRLRAAERRTVEVGTRRITAVALAPDDLVVGFSEVRVDSPSAPLAAVGGTLVLPGHRGRDLGLAMKLGTHARLVALRAAGEVACTHVETQNATDNAAVARVNDLLGYRVVERALDLQKVVGPI